MKRQIFFLLMLGIVGFGATNAVAQCDTRNLSQIRCSYYNEGYQDGINDAQSSRSNDYRRYRAKYDRVYEGNYRDGYGAGYQSVNFNSGGVFGGNNRWTTSQRNAYNAGYDIGVNDRRRGRQTESGQGYGGYDRNIGLYFQLGYRDAFENRPRTYDQSLGGGGGFGGGIYPVDPGFGSGNNRATWSGRVDDRANIIIQGNNIRTEDASGSGLNISSQNVIGSLPRRAVSVSARRLSGRGSATVIQQPSRENGFTAIVQIYDSGRGADDYRVEIDWDRNGGGGGFGGGNGGGFGNDDPYRSGSVRWTGRVDQSANIIIDGGNVQTEDTSGTGLSNVDFRINGVLVRRSGNVTARKLRGRGIVRVIQQPSRNNGFVAIVQIFDAGGGADDYEVDITW